MEEFYINDMRKIEEAARPHARAFSRGDPGPARPLHKQLSTLNETELP